MNLRGNTILITGGSGGVGLAMARALIRENTVIVCGRSEARLATARGALPGLHTEVCDVTDAQQREQLVARVGARFPELNILINNAGAKSPTDLLLPEGNAAAREQDLALNFTAPVALTEALLPHLQSRPRAAVVNVTTGLVYLAKAEQAFYCAAKAALHSYSQSLRWALRHSPVEVYEVMLSVVDTGFHHGRLPSNLPAISADEAAALMLLGIRKGLPEIRIGKAKLARWISVLAPNRGLSIVNGARA